jgi:hypothetical protein
MTRSIRGLAAFAALAAVLLSTGCALQAPAYSPAVDNVERLKKDGVPTRVGAVSVAPGAPGGQSIGLRGSAMGSAIGSDFGAYIAEALRLELQLAGKLDPAAKVEIGGVLIKNDISAAGLSTNSGEIEARFTVRRDGTLRYEKVHRIEASWESSFLGSVAIPKAQQQYPMLVQQLLRQLFSDRAFFDALR